MAEAMQNFAQAQLRAVVERIERLEEEKAGLAGDIREVYAEAKGHGFDTTTIRRVVKLRKEDTAKRQEAQALLDLYLHALGMQADLPLEEAAAAAPLNDLIAAALQPDAQEAQAAE